MQTILPARVYVLTEIRLYNFSFGLQSYKDGELGIPGQPGLHRNPTSKKKKKNTKQTKAKGANL
jgi:hypothetical protein